jgi:hypothetical protein
MLLGYVSGSNWSVSNNSTTHAHEHYQSSKRKVRPCTDTATLDVPSLTDTTPAAHPHMHGYNTYLRPRGPLLLALQECNTPVCTRTPVGPGGTCTHPFGPLTAQHEMPNSTMSPAIGTTQISNPYIQHTHRRSTVK